MGIFISRDEMNPEQALAFDLGHAAATEQAKQREAELVERVEQLQTYVEKIALLDPDLGLLDAHALVEDARVLATRQREDERG